MAGGDGECKAAAAAGDRDEEESRAVDELRGAVGGTEVDPKSDRAALRRFLRARQGDVAKAAEMVREWRAWREEFRVDELRAADVAREVRSGKASWNGRDREGRPALVVLPRRHFPHQRYTVRETMRFAVWTVERGVALAEAAGASQFCVVYDREGFGEVNRDRSLFYIAREIVHVLQVAYAERLGVYYIVLHGRNRMFWLLFRIITPLLSAETRAKIRVIEKPEERPLLRHFDAASLPRAYGGELADEFEYRDILGWAERRPARDGDGDGDGVAPLWRAEAVQRVRKRHEVVVDVTGAMLAAAPPVALAGGDGDDPRAAREAAELAGATGMAALVWRWSTEAHDVAFGVDRDGESVFDSRRLREHDGWVEVAAPGRYTLVWDNSFSYFRGKTVRLDVSLVPLVAAPAPPVPDPYLEHRRNGTDAAGEGDADEEVLDELIAEGGEMTDAEAAALAAGLRSE